ncbi:MAG: hypothetical protein K2M76_07490 [Muribaculaceae bacterium]|nr:hypothetical protein [Muribaculaceae bacterium]
MKKSLLLSLMATAGMTAFAAQPVAENVEMSASVGTAAEKAAVKTSMNNMYMTPVGNPVVSKITTKADDDKLGVPFYNLPGGVFAEGFASGEGLLSWYYTSGSNKITHPVVVPSYVNINWEYTPLNSVAVPVDSMLWQYRYLQPSGDSYSILTNTVEKVSSITTPAYPFGVGAWINPIMATGTGANQKAFRYGTLQASYARSIVNGENHPSFIRYNVDAWANNESSANAVTDSLDLAAYYNFSSGNVKNIGFYIPKSDATYGMYGVVFTGIFQAAYQSDTFNFSVYKVNERTPRQLKNGGTGYEYALGEKLGGGYIPKDSIKPIVNGWQNKYIPVMEQLGAYELESYLNIDCDVVVMFEGYTCTKTETDYVGDLIRPGMLCAYNPMLECEGVMNYGTDGYLSTNMIYFYGENNAPWIPTSNMSGINLVYGTLAAYDEEDYYTFKAAAAGESKTFEFEPSMDLNDESGMAIIDGEGAYDWYEVTVGDLDENSGLQNVTVKVNALPAGVTGRSSDLLIKIPGAQQVIKISKGEVSGVDSVVSDAAVVSSCYFDLMGRELNAEPETGMFIRQDVKADGSKVATKVVK